MPEKKKQSSAKATQDSSEAIKITSKKVQKADQKATKKKEAIGIPLTYYWVKEQLREFANHKYFPDSCMTLFAFISIAIAFPLYPLAALVVFAILIFALTRMHPLAGLMALLFISLPMYLYQAPIIAMLYIVFLTASLLLGYKHYRVIILAYTLIALPFSFLGYFLEIPALVVGVLYIGLKRSLLAVTIALIVLPILASLTGFTLAAPLLFNSAGFSKLIASTAMSSYFTGLKAAPSLLALPGTIVSSITSFLSITLLFPQVLYLSIEAFAYNIIPIAIQLAVWLIVVFAIVDHVVRSRSAFKGTVSSLYSFVILGAFLALSSLSMEPIKVYAFIGFLITPIALLLLEINDINIVRALDVMKKDFLGLMGDAFEDLTSGTHETLDDIGNYEHTKEELREAILQPIEHKAIAGAYRIAPSKGILLFGPPGTGKTMMMRALSNEIRARFLYVKASSILSAHPGESSQSLAKIFNMARQHTPCILFFDEIDGIAGKRENISDDISRQTLSTLLSEMDGFQKIEGVVIVGATNVPHMIDSSIMRPGRFDKIIYMPLPDKEGRKAIFKHYSTLYPVSSDVDYDKLASLTTRFSGADIANVCKEAATHAGNESLRNSKALKITTEDLTRVVSGTKPSTSYAQLENYEEFRLDYERRMNVEEGEKKVKTISLDDVVNLESAKKALWEAVVVPLEHPELMKQYDIKSISGILLFGPPGCGKTMLMQATAGATEGLTMVSISGADLSKEGYDNAVKKLKEAFFRAKENTPSLFFIDEVDALVPNREGSSEESIRLTAEFLREFDMAKQSEGVVIVGATNRPDAIDSAIIRPGRLDKLIYASPPEKSAREKLFSMNLARTPMSESVDYAKLASASEGFTGADIANVCREVKMQALEANIKPGTESSSAVDTAMVLKVIKNTKPSAPVSVTGRYLTFLSEHGRE